MNKYYYKLLGCAFAGIHCILVTQVKWSKQRQQNGTRWSDNRHPKDETELDVGGTKAKSWCNILRISNGVREFDYM